MPSVEEEFHPEPHSARAVRTFVAEVTSGASRLDDIVLAASELATNVIRHARTPYTVRVTSQDRRVRLEVHDESSEMPEIQKEDAPRRGLRMVDVLADDWGVDPTATGKVIWAEFAEEAKAEGTGREAAHRSSPTGV